MGDSEDPEGEVFEITDFTSASDWERFVGALTELLHEWRPAADDGDSETTHKYPSLRHATLDFAGCGFHATFLDTPAPMPGTATAATGEHLSAGTASSASTPREPRLPDAIQELASADGEFTSAHPVTEAFGVTRFVLLAPAQEPGVNSASKARLLLSCAHLALREAAWEVPVFVQVHHPVQQFFLGACLGEGCMAEFQTILLRRAPPRLYHLSGLLELFKDKLRCSSLPPVRVSVRLQYTIEDFGAATYSPSEDDPADLETVLPPGGMLQKLPLDVATNEEPVAALELSACWQQVPETMLVEDEFSRLSARGAPGWSLAARPTTRAVGLLGLCLRDVWLLCHRKDTFENLLGRPLQDTPAPGPPSSVAAVLSRLTEGRHAPGAGSGVSGTNSGSGTEPSGVDETSDYVDNICADMFSALDGSPPPSLPAFLPKPVKERLSEVRSGRPGDLLWRLAAAVSVLARSRATALICRLWERFLQQLRHQWDTAQPLPGVAEGRPDFSTAIIHQQLQMLNCCIEKRAEAVKTSSGQNEGGDTEEDDEFFDADSEAEAEAKGEAGRLPEVRHAPWNQPEGRLRRCGSLLLREIRQPLYIPVTQEVAPMTEDRLQEQSQVLVSLGTDPEGCQLRARLMAASLTSDMEAFKAANPGCTLGDFVRWYSPCDWIQEDDDPSGQSGELSPRMRLADNLWVETWTACKPVPARRQRRLFDETREAERVLHELAALSLAQIVQRLAPIIYRAAIYRLCEELVPSDAAIGSQLEEATKRLHSAAKHDWEPAAYEAIGKLLTSCEHHILRRRSLALKLFPGSNEDNYEFIQRLIGGAEIGVPGGAHGTVGKQLENMLTAETLDGEFPDPTRKEYVLRVPCRRPGAGSRPLPQRMRTLITKEQFRVTAALCSDTCVS